MTKLERKSMKFYRIYTKENAYVTGQPRGIFTAAWKLVEEGIMNEKEKVY